MTAEEDFDKQCADAERIKEIGMDEQRKQVEQLPPEGMQLPPQVKFGIAVMELDDGSVVRMPINPNELQITYGQMLRLILGELEDIRAEVLAMKIKNLTRQQMPPQAGGGLVDPV